MTEKKSKSTIGMFSEAMRELLPYTNLGWQLAATILLFFGAGYALDAWLETGELFTVILSLTGVIAGLVSVLRSAADLEKKRTKKK